MSRTAWMWILILDLVFGFLSAVNGNTSATIFNCFLGYISFQFMTKDGGNNNVVD